MTLEQQPKFKHWTFSTDDDNIIWLNFDKQDASVNSLDQLVLEEFDVILNEIKNKSPQGLVIQSAKDNGFIAGADIKQFKDINSKDLVVDNVTKVQNIFYKLSNLTFPTVALIKGFCLGGGLELALACDYRIAVEQPKTKLGLPEVMLGIQPGWGGTVRLPKIIGTLRAMDLILSGRTVNVKRALKIGLIDCKVPIEHIKRAVYHYIIIKPAVKSTGLFDRILQSNCIRPLVSKVLHYKVAKKVNRNHYPAPFAIIDNWTEHNIYSQDAFKAEAKSIANLIMSPTSRNLVRVFFLQEQLKDLAKASSYEFKHVHVIGAGIMGGDIAAWCAFAGYKVSLQDQSSQAIASTLQRAKKLFTKKLKERHLIKAAQDRLIPDEDGVGVGNADIIIEAIVENKVAKSELFKHLEQVAKKDAVLATNTSTIELKDIATNMQNPSRIIGIHFFNPVAQMPLVEVVSDKSTNKIFVDKALSFVGTINKLPLPVKSSPGFLVNRILMPYLVESITLLEEGVPATVIDKVAKDFGMPMGPIELADTIGLDVCLAAANSLGAQLSDQIKTMVQAGNLGKKTGQGFYRYKKGKLIKPKNVHSSNIENDVGDRLFMRMINEAMACLGEGIVTDAKLLDAGMIFGAGFAPFRGGVMRYIEEEQAENIRNKLASLAERYGKRFTASKGWAV